MTPHFFTRRTLVFLTGLLILLCAFTAFEAHRHYLAPHTERTTEPPETAATGQKAEAAFQSQQAEPFLNDTQKCHLALLGESLCVFAGPVDGGGELLQQLDIPLKNIPPRWLAQLTNGGIEFPNEETLLMALDNLDELTEENREVVALPVY